MNINHRSNSFKKTGKEFKEVLARKINELKQRLAKRNIVLNELLDDKNRLRSYLLRSARPVAQAGGQHRNWANNLTSYGPEHIGVEEVEEIKQLCARVFQIENEIKAYEILRNNLADSDVVELTLQELLQYGFE